MGVLSFGIHEIGDLGIAWDNLHIDAEYRLAANGGFNCAIKILSYEERKKWSLSSFEKVSVFIC